MSEDPLVFDSNEDNKLKIKPNLADVIPKDDNLKATTHRDPTISLSRVGRIAIYIILLTVEFSINNSIGILSSASKNIKASLQIDDANFGKFGVANGIGKIVGASLFILIVNYYDRKWSYLFFLSIKVTMLLFSKLSNSLYILLLSRLILGLAQMPLSIYIPIWIDQFALARLKIVFMTIYQVAKPSGKVGGFLIHIIVGEDNWKNGFVIEGLYLLFVLIFILCCPGKYFSMSLVRENENEKKKQKIKRSAKRKETQFLTLKTKEKPSFWNDLQRVIKNEVFIFGIIVRAMLFGVNTALHYWISDYMRNVLLIKSSSKIFISYSIIAVTGPIGGVFAGFIVSIFLGGYEHKQAVLVIFILHLISSAFGMCIPIMRDLTTFAAVAALYFVFNSSELGIVQGVIISSVNEKLRGSAYSICNLITMIFTSTPSPYLYGLINQWYKDVYAGMGMLALMLVEVLTIIPIVILWVLRIRRLGKIEKMQKVIEKRKKEEYTIADEIGGAVNDASFEIDTSIHKSRQELEAELQDDEGDVEMKTKE